MKILVITAEALCRYNENNGTALTAGQLTDDQFKEINREFCGEKAYGSVEEFILAFNSDGTGAPTPERDFLRAVPDGSFPITSVTREDLNAKGFDTREVSDETMERLASKMADDYIDQLFWISLDILAEDAGIPRNRNIEEIREGIDTILYLSDISKEKIIIKENTLDANFNFTLDAILVDDDDELIFHCSNAVEEVDYRVTELDPDKVRAVLEWLRKHAPKFAKKEKS